MPIFKIVNRTDHCISHGYDIEQFRDEYMNLEDTHLVSFNIESNIFTMLRYLELGSSIHQPAMANPSVIDEGEYPYSSTTYMPFSLLTMNYYHLLSHKSRPKSPSHLLEIIASGEYAKDVIRFKDSIFDKLVGYIGFESIEVEDRLLQVSSKCLINSRLFPSTMIFNKSKPLLEERCTYYTYSSRHVSEVCSKANDIHISTSTTNDIQTTTITSQVSYEPLFSLCPSEHLKDMDKIWIGNTEMNRYLRVIDKIEQFSQRM